MFRDHIREGLTTTFKKEVTASDAVDSLDFLLSTPAIMNMVIEDAVKMLDVLLTDDQITVGRHIELYHEKPTLIGETISITLTVRSVKGNSITLDIACSDSIGLVCRGSCERVIVDRTKLYDIAYSRSALLERPDAT